MNCPRCGDENYDYDRFCSTCGLDLATYRNLWPQAPVGASAETAVGPPPASTDTPDSPIVLAPPAPIAVGPPRVPSYLGWAAALTTLCWPAFWAGIPALVHAGRVEARLAADDLFGAQEASDKARTWCWVTFLAGTLLWMIALALLALL